MAHTIVTIVGSLRKESFSLKIANALAKLAPASLKLDVTTLGGISFFNQDLEAAPPADWLAFRDKIQKSDGVLFVTPEYNRAIPGVLKNAIDVGSRPYGKSSFLGKPIGIVSNSPGPLGGVNAYTGKYGLNAQQELDQEIVALTSELARLKRERAEGEQRVSLLRSDRVDPDMLDERARFQLDYANPRDLVRINKPN